MREGEAPGVPVRRAGVRGSANVADTERQRDATGGNGPSCTDIPVGAPLARTPQEDGNSPSHLGPGESEPDQHLSTPTGWGWSTPLLISMLFTMANIGCLCAYYNSSFCHESPGTALPNGDHVASCPDRPGDENCFQMLDFSGRTVYRSEGRKRVLALHTCDPSAAETERFKCTGEYAFSHNSTVTWFHRLYEDRSTGKFSLVSGPHSRDRTVTYPRVRHMLSEPYNWIVSHESIPSDDFPHSSIYVHGKVMVDPPQEPASG